MDPRRKQQVEEMLERTPAAAPPEGLFEKLKGEIPRDLPRPLPLASRPTVFRAAGMKAAAALLLAAAAGLLGYRLVEMQRPSAVASPGRGNDTSRDSIPDRQIESKVEVGAPAAPPKDGERRVKSALERSGRKVADPRTTAVRENEVATTAGDRVAQSVTVHAEAPLVTSSASVPQAVAAPPAPPPASVEGGVPAGVIGGVVGGTGPGAAVAKARLMASGPTTVQPPSTGGTREPNDAPYGDVFFKEYGTNPFVDTDDDRLSTFGLDVDTGSYTVARRYINDGNLPPREAIRVEEFVNAFSYGDRPPARGDFAIRAEAAPTPFMKGNLYRVVRFNVRARVVDPKDRKPAVLTFVVDVSGSMAYENRLELVKKALGLLLDRLDASDRVGLVVYGSEARRVLDPTSDREAIREAVAQLAPDGSTNAEDGLRMGYAMAARFRLRDGINRVILCSDGVANVGRTGPDSILEVIEREAKDNEIELTTVGFGMGNYNDVLMEQLANRGDGRYAYVDTLAEARRIFVEELTGTLQTIATDAKAQVEFEPSVVSRWRLLGYENRDIADEKFRDDTVDAGEIGAGHSVTALYEIKLAEDAPRRGTVATLRLRYRSKETGKVVELAEKLSLSDVAPSWDAAPRGLKLATLVAEFAELLKGNYWAKDGDLAEVARRAREFAGDERTSEFASLVERAKSLAPRKPGAIAVPD